MWTRWFSAVYCSGLMAKITSKTDSSNSPVGIVLNIHFHVIDKKKKGKKKTWIRRDYIHEVFWHAQFLSKKAMLVMASFTGSLTPIFSCLLSRAITFITIMTNNLTKLAEYDTNSGFSLAQWKSIILQYLLGAVSYQEGTTGVFAEFCSSCM